MINVSCVVPYTYTTFKTNNTTCDARRSLLSENCSSNLTILLSRCQDICSFFHLRHTEIGEEDGKNISLISQVANTCSCQHIYLCLGLHDIQTCSLHSVVYFYLAVNVTLIETQYQIDSIVSLTCRQWRVGAN